MSSISLSSIQTSKTFKKNDNFRASKVLFMFLLLLPLLRFILQNQNKKKMLNVSEVEQTILIFKLFLTFLAFFFFISILCNFNLDFFTLHLPPSPHPSCSLTTSPPLHPCLPSLPPAVPHTDRCAHTHTHGRPGSNYLQTLLWHTTFATSPPDCTQMLSQPN